jgi:hypothetical protein
MHAADLHFLYASSTRLLPYPLHRFPSLLASTDVISTLFLTLFHPLHHQSINIETLLCLAWRLTTRFRRGRRNPFGESSSRSIRDHLTSVGR